MLAALSTPATTETPDVCLLMATYFVFWETALFASFR